MGIRDILNKLKSNSSENITLDEILMAEEELDSLEYEYRGSFDTNSPDGCITREGHYFGLSLQDDLEVLYGKDYREINRVREELFEKLENSGDHVKVLREVVKNPSPLSLEELDSWAVSKKAFMERGLLGTKDLEILDQIEQFVRKYHVL